MSVETVIDQMQGCIDAATKARGDLAKSGDALDHDAASRLNWLDRQLTARIVQVQGLMLDLEAGLPLSSLGYGNEVEIMEVLEDIETEIRQLQRMIREIKGLAR
ncbi:hypothetical protein RHDC4_00276 [Rhodocyclaceae bacterium]|nr:hypothetical protein RHDC4_00276 [Rhodocyclaceae bacterium]